MNAGRCEYVAASIVESWDELIYLYGSVIWYQRRKQAVFFRIRPPYVLRGWKGIPWVLVKQPENTTERLSRKEFETLLLCDGETNLDGQLDDEKEKIIAQYQQQQVIDQYEEPCPLTPEQYYRYFDNRYVDAVFWSITGRCNYRCRHCYMDAPDSMLGELSTEQALDLIDQMAACGVLHVDITGGEPFVRKDFWQLVDRMLAHQIAVGKIYTNGWLLNDKILDAFEQRGLKPHVSISFDGVGWHDWMRGVNGAEQAALQALRLCHERGLVTDVEMCIHRGNLDGLPQTVEALRKVGVTNLKVSNVSMTELWRCHSDGNALDNAAYVEAMLPYINWYYRAGQPMNHLVLSNVIVLDKDKPYRIVAEPYDGTEQCLDCLMCNAARWACYITPDGRLLPCMPMTASPEQERFPKVQDIGLQQGLSDSYYMQFVNGTVKDLLAANAECAACSYRFRCGGGCRATALLEGNHDLMGCDRTMCMLWKGGYVDRIRQIADEAIAQYRNTPA